MRIGPMRSDDPLHSSKPPGRSLMSVGGNAAPRGMTAHDRIRLTGPLAEVMWHPLDRVARWCPVWMLDTRRNDERNCFQPRANPRSPEHLILQPDRAPDRSTSGDARSIQLSACRKVGASPSLLFYAPLSPATLSDPCDKARARFYFARCPIRELWCEASAASSSAMRARSIRFKSATLCGSCPMSLSNLRRTARNESSRL